MRVWIDIENPPQVQYLAPFKASFESLGHDVIVTAQDHSITLDLLAARGIAPRVIGRRGGSTRARKVARVLGRSALLSRSFVRRRASVLVATSRAATISAWAQRIPMFTFCDYEHVDFNAVRAARAYVFHPDVIDQNAFTSRGLKADRLLPFHGLKEAISFSGVDIEGTPPYVFAGAAPAAAPRVLFRPPGEETHYYVPESGSLSMQLLAWLAEHPEIVLVYAPRYPYQEGYLDGFDWANQPIVLREGVPFVSLLKSVDLVISSGGTMLREAAYLGLPAYSIFRSSIGQVDTFLASKGRLTILESPAAFERIRLEQSTLDPLTGPPELLERLTDQMVRIAGRSTGEARQATDSYAA